MSNLAIGANVSQWKIGLNITIASFNDSDQNYCKKLLRWHLKIVGFNYIIICETHKIEISD